jgi:DNA recombination protein RmuC
MLEVIIAILAVAVVVLAILAVIYFRKAASAEMEIIRLQAHAQAQLEAQSRTQELLDRQARDQINRLEGSLEAVQAELRSADDSLRTQMARVAELHGKLEASQQQSEQALASLKREHSQQLDHIRSLSEEKLQAVEQARKTIEHSLANAQEQLVAVFQSSASKALSDAQGQFLVSATETLKTSLTAGTGEIEAKRKSIDTLVGDLRERMTLADKRLLELQAEWSRDRGALTEQVRNLHTFGQALRDETSKLSRSLRDPGFRGQYGEIQLKRVVELAGMSEHCDFSVQETIKDDAGDSYRPDMVVRMPSGRCVVVDAKTPIKPFLDALETSDPQQQDMFVKELASQFATRIRELGRKRYHAKFDGSPEFVVMFVPGEQFLEAALRGQRDLLEQAWQQGVILAGPTMLIGLLRAVHVGYQEEKLSREAANIRDLCKTLYERFVIAMEHLSESGQGLDKAVRKYNEFVRSFETRIKPQFDKLEEAGAKATKELPKLEAIQREVKLDSPLFGVREATSDEGARR